MFFVEDKSTKNMCWKVVDKAFSGYILYNNHYMQGIQKENHIYLIVIMHSSWAVQWSWFAWVNALCNLSCKKLQEIAASLPGRFQSRHCFTLCITMEVEPRIVKQYKCHHCCCCKNYWGKGMEGGKKVSASLFGWPDREFVGKSSFWGIA